MRALLTTALVALTLVTPVAAQQQPPGLQQTLQGLLSGNANQDQAVREADERGYQRGREDEVRLRRDRSGTSERSRSYDPAAPLASAYGGHQDA